MYINTNYPLARPAQVANIVLAVGDVGAENELLLPMHRRGQAWAAANDLGMLSAEDQTYWRSDDGQAMLATWRGESGAAKMLISLTDLVRAASSETMVECLIEHFGSVRKAFEKSTPVTQCHNTIGGAKKGDYCWICGGLIVSGNVQLNPECEHVFPVAQALCFVGLYESQFARQLAEDKGVNVAAGYVDGIRREYRWAHSVCNRIKSDANFITIDEKGRRFQISSRKITELLEKLPSRRLGVSDRDRGRWIAARTDAMELVARDLLESAAGVPFEQAGTVTVMAMTSYLNSIPECRISPPPKSPPAEPRAGTGVERPRPETYPLSHDIARAEFFINQFVALLLGSMQNALDNNARDIGTARERARISQYLSTEYISKYQGYMQEQFSPHNIQVFRQQVVVALRNSSVGDENLVFRTFGPTNSNMLMAAIAVVSREWVKNESRTTSRTDADTESVAGYTLDEHAGFLERKVLNTVDAWKSDAIQLAQGMLGYTVDDLYDIVIDRPPPEWLPMEGTAPDSLTLTREFSDGEDFYTIYGGVFEPPDDTGMGLAPGGEDEEKEKEDEEGMFDDYSDSVGQGTVDVMTKSGPAQGYGLGSGSAQGYGQQRSNGMDRSVGQGSIGAGGEGPLPDGWEERVSMETGRHYYYNWKTGASTYERPRYGGKRIGGRRPLYG